MIDGDLCGLQALPHDIGDVLHFSFQLLVCGYNLFKTELFLSIPRLPGLWLPLSSQRTRQRAILASDCGEYPPADLGRPRPGLPRLVGATCLDEPAPQQSACATT